VAQRDEVDEGPMNGGKGLTRSEDQELRQLTWFSKIGDVSEKTMARVLELLGRDRRAEVRDPRPDPREPEEYEPTTLPPIEMDRAASMVCPNCGAMWPDRDRAR
jgi:hypothetical protein